MDTDHSSPKRTQNNNQNLKDKQRLKHKNNSISKFLKDLLLNPTYCPSVIYWEDYKSRKFRLVDGAKIAKLWGEKKNNPKMNYERFTRMIRQRCYKNEIIIPVVNEKLVYKFGKSVTGLHTSNPNFGFKINNHFQNFA